jgi:hypothetical protein
MTNITEAHKTGHEALVKILEPYHQEILKQEHIERESKIKRAITIGAAHNEIISLAETSGFRISKEAALKAVAMCW